MLNLGKLNMYFFLNNSLADSQVRVFNLETYSLIPIAIVFLEELPNRVPAGVVRLKTQFSSTFMILIG